MTVLRLRCESLTFEIEGEHSDERRGRMREKLWEFYREEVRPELCAVAALNNVELITALISCNRQLGREHTM